MDDFWRLVESDDFYAFIVAAALLAGVFACAEG